MASKKNKVKRVSYKALLEWRIANGLSDEWLILVAGKQANEVYSLDQIRQMQFSSPKSVICVLNLAFAQDPDAEWLQYREINLDAKKTQFRAPNFYEHFACAYGTIVLLFLVGSLMFQVRIEAGLPGIIGFPVVALIYAFIRRAGDSKRADALTSIRQELANLHVDNLVAGQGGNK